jgi:hypothetical protein
LASPFEPITDKALADQPEDASKQDEAQPDDPPPFLKTWPRVYRAVILYLIVLIFALYLVTRAFAPNPGI